MRIFLKIFSYNERFQPEYARKVFSGIQNNRIFVFHTIDNVRSGIHSSFIVVGHYEGKEEEGADISS